MSAFDESEPTVTISLHDARLIDRRYMTPEVRMTDEFGESAWNAHMNLRRAIAGAERTWQVDVTVNGYRVVYRSGSEQPGWVRLIAYFDARWPGSAEAAARLADDLNDDGYVPGTER